MSGFVRGFLLIVIFLQYSCLPVILTCFRVLDLASVHSTPVCLHNLLTSACYLDCAFCLMSSFCIWTLFISTSCSTFAFSPVCLLTFFLLKELTWSHEKFIQMWTSNSNMVAQHINTFMRKNIQTFTRTLNPSVNFVVMKLQLWDHVDRPRCTHKSLYGWNWL